MLAARQVGGLDVCLVYDHASHWKPLNRYTLHSCSRYLTNMLMLHWGGGGGGNLRRVLQRGTAPTEQRSSNYVSAGHLK